MPKARVSHFITKNIPINENTRPITRVDITKIQEKPDKKNSPKIVSTSKVTKRESVVTKRVSARDFVKSEISYAVTPRKPSSELIGFIIRRDANEFRNITKKINNQNNGQIKSCKKTNKGIDHSNVQ